MHKLFALKIRWGLTLFGLLDLMCVGLGMGVPIFCILFGLPVGWVLARRVTMRPREVGDMLGRLLAGAALTSAFTLVAMALLWGSAALMLVDTQADLANFGIPMILYEPKASFIGWLALMVLISPFLQFLMTLFGAQVTLWWQLGRRGAG